PVVHANLRQPGAPAAFVGPALVPARHPLAALTGVSNGVCLQSPHASLFYSGPGAGPDVTAATILDDVAEVLAGNRDLRRWRASVPATVSARAEGGWFVRLRAAGSLPQASDTADLLGAHDVWTSRITDPSTQSGADCRWMLTLPCARPRIERALRSLE